MTGYGNINLRNFSKTVLVIVHALQSAVLIEKISLVVDTVPIATVFKICSSG